MAEPGFLKELVACHNDFRSRHGVAPLTHSPELSTFAQAWAETLARSGRLDHNPSRFKGEQLGENVAMKWGTGADYTGREVTEQWYSEGQRHEFGSEPVDMNTGHFSQVVWRGSREIGVGKAKSPDGKVLVVANYRPAGNVRGQFASNVLPPKHGASANQSLVKSGPARANESGAYGEDRFRQRFDQMNRDFQGTSLIGQEGLRGGESRSVRTRTVTEGSGRDRVTRVIQEETITAADGSQTVHVEETTTYPDGRKTTNRKTTHTGPGGVSSSTDDSASKKKTGGSKLGRLFGHGDKDKDKDKDKASRGRGLRKGSSSSSDSSPERGGGRGGGKKPETMSAFIDSCLKAHNSYRSKHGASSLKHAKDLTAHAQSWAERLASSGSFEHSACVLGGERIGENIACKWSSGSADYTGQEVSDYWYSEVAKHDFSAERSLASGHFSQMVWKASKEVGFGKAKGAGGKVVVVANYRPPGNVLGHYRDNVAPAKK